ncbi:potassium voltage-gated channel subfamily A member 10 [Hydra vulgaris]|uniref:potassium voltage-gated channel subfamily A member 10 n=1 Tax=Hydra vulgaris TaxID=6087 RepID=UPI00019256D4|nr:potassium voltage-gated channel subfamily A member 10 [Hydra vulgaris]
MLGIQAPRRVRFNIAGTIYETFLETLERFPSTLLGDSLRRVDFFDSNTNTYYINHSAIAFDAILFYYQSNGRLIRPPHVPMEIFEEECVFYDLGTKAIGNMKAKEGYEFDDTETTLTDFRKLTKFQKLWQFFEEPTSSLAAQIYLLITLIITTTTVMIDCFVTLAVYGHSDTFRVLDYVSNYTNFIFLAEFFARLISTPSKPKFFKSTRNIVDILAILPLITFIAITDERLQNVLFHKVFRLFRVLRLTLWARYFRSLKMVLEILSNCVSDILMLILFIAIASTLLGTITYYAELEDKNSPVSSVPDGMWLAVQTIVTLGYGDIIPVTVIGKLFTALTAAVGALTVILPLLSLEEKYIDIYTKMFRIKAIHLDPLKPFKKSLKRMSDRK